MHTHNTQAKPSAWLIAFSFATALAGLIGFNAQAQALHPVFGRAATPSEVTAVNIDVMPNGAGLPAGSGTVTRGQAIYASQCASCHGATGIEGPRDRLVGGQGTLATSKPIKTIGSYWQYAPTIYDYIGRAMPFTAPGNLKPDEVYSLVAFLLNRNGVIDAGQIIDARTLPLVKMPNRDGFIDEPAFRNVRRK